MHENKYDMEADETRLPPRCVDCGGEKKWNDEKQEWECRECASTEEVDDE